MALSLAATLEAGAAEAAVQVTHIPLKTGLTLISALHFPAGDRESVVTVAGSAANGVTYTWHASAREANGAKTEAIFSRYVSAADLAGATRLNTVFRDGDQADYPGYTAFSLSTAVYETLRTAGTATFSLAALPEGNSAGALGGFGGGLGAVLQGNVRYKGVLSRAAAQPEPFELLLNGRPATAPALHVRGRLSFQDQHRDPEFWVLADSAHPLILKTVIGSDVLQTVRIEMPGDDVMPASLAIVERELDQQCRAELPGIYFAFGTAELDRASNATLQKVGAMLQRHPQWTLAVEGHTDNIGTDAANQILSQQRAQAVQTSLTAEHSIAASRLQAIGFGASRPRESNSTLSGRARNRRVELVRPCATRSSGDTA